MTEELRRAKIGLAAAVVVVPILVYLALRGPAPDAEPSSAVPIEQRAP